MPLKLKLDLRYEFPIGPRSTGIARRFGIYEPETSRLLKRELKKGDVVLELGACEGYFTVQMSKMVGKAGKVYSVEPASDYFDLLSHNVKLNRLKNVILLRKGLASKQDITTLFSGIDSRSNFQPEPILDFLNKTPEDFDFIFIDIDAVNDSGKVVHQETNLLIDILRFVEKKKIYPKIFVESKEDLSPALQGFKQQGYSRIQRLTRKHYFLGKD